MKKLSLLLLIISLQTNAAGINPGLFGDTHANANKAINDPDHIFEIVNDNTPYQDFSMSSYGANTYQNNMHFNRYNGTLAAPAPITGGEYFLSEGYRGWDGSGYLSQSMGQYGVFATENWTPNYHGLGMLWQITANGTSVRRNGMALDQTGLKVTGDVYASTNIQVGSNEPDNGATGTIIMQRGGCGAAVANGAGRLCVGGDGALYYRSSQGTTTKVAPF